MVNLNLKKVQCPGCESLKTIKPCKYGMGVPSLDENFIIMGCIEFPNAPEFGCIKCDWTGHAIDLISNSVSIKKDEIKNLSRIVLPNLEIEVQVHAAGLAIISAFTADLFEYINLAMIKSEGKNWLAELKFKDHKNYDLNFSDPSVLLKELVRNSQSILRKPINNSITKSNIKEFYDTLDEILGERHLWVHHDIEANSEQLQNLITLIHSISDKLDLSVVKECKELFYLINPEDKRDIEDKIHTENKPSEIIQKFETLTKDEEFKVGSAIPGPFLSFSYTLHLSGSIRDRKTEELLEDLVGESAKTLGELLIARKPSGGRLRITSEGIIAAYFDDQWGFLGKTKKDNWFPGHLK